MLDAKIDNPCFIVNYIEYFDPPRRLIIATLFLPFSFLSSEF